MGLFDKILGKKNDKAQDRGARYDHEKEIAQGDDTDKRLTLAQDTDTNKEILYYMAENDPDPAVRKAVAENESTPPQVTPLLARDADQDVRLALAERLVQILPEATDEKHSQLYAFIVQALGTLALDEVLRIRVALSSTLKDHAHTPPKIAGQLARDVEREVSEPILRFCAALSDDDLIDILKTHPDSWVVQAVAKREEVSEDVSDAVIETDDRPAGAALLENEGANITPGLLEHIVTKARDYPEWQKPMALRPHLPVSVAQDLAEFVDASVRDILMQRPDFDEQVTEEIAAVFRRRVDFASEGVEEEESAESVQKRLQKVVADGRLNEETISDALAMRDRPFVNAAIAEMGGIALDDVVRVFEMKSPKAIVALAWKAKLSMRMALQLQKDIGHIQPKELIYPKDGTDYALSEEEITWQLEFLGLKAA